ncbi:glycosyltransferase [candidate division CSSED10-310 bacterium]|uniref:Glycosyltransferase n=1 Tax=candidate division CSSED10-310 bacterium TaxID=2855610 RepID=A0ABV6Z5X8_UNCC1
MPKIRILFVTNDMEIGGVQRLLLDLLGALDRTCFEPTVALVCAAGPLIRDLEQRNIETVFFPCIRRNKYFKWINPLSILRLILWLKHHQFQVVNTHLFLGNTIGRIAARLAGCPIIIATEHNTYLFKSRIQQKIDKILARISDTIIAVTAAVAEFTAHQEKISRQKFVVIHNGTDIQRFEQNNSDRDHIRQAYSIPEQNVIIGSIGRFVPQKDFSLLVQAFRLFQDHNPASNLMLVGDGPERSLLQKTAFELGISEHVIFTGFQNEVRPFLTAMDVFALTPVYEGLGLVLLEAMASGVPVVAAHVGGIPEVVLDGETGILIANREPQSYAQAFSHILENHDFRKKMCQAAKIRVQEHFSIQKMTLAYETLFKQSLHQ